MIEILAAKPFSKPPANFETKVLCHFDGVAGGRTIVDEMGNTCTLTGSAKTTIQPVAAKFGATGLQSSGGLQVGGLVIQGNEIMPTDGSDYCIEFFTRNVGGAAGSSYSLFSYGPLSLTRHPASGSFTVSDSANSSAKLVYVANTTYAHMTMAKFDDQFHFFVNGVLQHSSPQTNNMALSSMYFFYDTFANANYPSTAYLDELRVTLGSPYSGAFTVPTAPFTP